MEWYKACLSVKVATEYFYEKRRKKIQWNKSFYKCGQKCVISLSSLKVKVQKERNLMTFGEKEKNNKKVGTWGAERWQNFTKKEELNVLSLLFKFLLKLCDIINLKNKTPNNN